jgi:hypothetical protein
MLMGSNLAENSGFLRAIKICYITSFGGEVNPLAQCCKILEHVTDPYSKNEIPVGKIHRHFLPSFSCLTARCLCWLLSESSGE